MKYSFMLLLTSLLAYGCTSPLPVQNQQPIESNISLIQSSKINGANLSVNISFKKLSTKNNTNGKPAKTVNDIQSVKLYLTTSNGTNPLLANNVKFSSGVLAYPTGQTTKTYTFFNVPAGTYYVAAELFSDVSGTTNIIEPITYDSAVSGDTANLTGGKRGLTISSNSATVASNNTFTFSDNLSSYAVAPKLLNALGAGIDSTITTNPGSVTPVDPIAVQ